MRLRALPAVPRWAPGVYAPCPAAVRAADRRDHRRRLRRCLEGGCEPASARASLQPVHVLRAPADDPGHPARRGSEPARFRDRACPIQDSGLIGHYVPGGTVHFVRVYSRWEEEKIRRPRDEGFPVEILDPGEEKKISGTEVRRLMREGLPWEHLVPAARRRSSVGFSSRTPLGSGVLPRSPSR